MKEIGLVDWLRDESKRELDRFLGIRSPSQVYSAFGKEITEAFVDGFDAALHDPDYLRWIEIQRHKQWLHYVALQRKPEHKFKKARIRNGLM